MIKELTEEFKQFTCLGENPEKYLIFSVLIEKEATRFDKKYLFRTKNYQKNFDENLIKSFVNTYKFLTMISINLFYCCEKVFTRMNT